MCYAAMRHLFGSLNNMSIVEIGGGYGGQAAVIGLAEYLRRYDIVDLQEPVQLQARFLAKFDIRTQWSVNVEPPLDRGWNLCISSCAFSELDEAKRTHYVERVLSRSRAGWLTWNWPPEPVDGWIVDPRDARDWLASVMPGVDIRLGRDNPEYREIVGSWADLHIYWGAK
jgi:hypothetical protein